MTALLLAPGSAGADVIPPPSSSTWTLGGSATFDSSGNLQLTAAGQGGAAGSAYWPVAVAPATLTASFDETISGSGNTADGLAFDLLDSTSVQGGMPATGDSGAALGFGFSNRGRAIAFVENAAPWSCYPSDHFIGIADGTEDTTCPTLNYLTTASGLPALVGATHQVTVTVTFGASPTISVTLDGTQEITYADTDATTPFPSNVFVGFSGGTGIGTETDTISNVSISYTTSSGGGGGGGSGGGGSGGGGGGGPQPPVCGSTQTATPTLDNFGAQICRFATDEAVIAEQQLPLLDAAAGFPKVHQVSSKGALSDAFASSSSVHKPHRSTWVGPAIGLMPEAVAPPVQAAANLLNDVLQDEASDVGDTIGEKAGLASFGCVASTAPAVSLLKALQADQSAAQYEMEASDELVKALGGSKAAGSYEIGGHIGLAAKAIIDKI